MNRKVSIIVPMYNCIKSIENCVESIVNQTYEDIECILVNDGSTDETLNKCGELRKKYPCINILDKKNGGVSSARNMGIEQATGKFILFVDSDDALEIDYVSKLVNNFKEGVLIGSSIKVVEEVNTSLIDRSIYSFSANDLIINILKNTIDGYSWGYLFESSIVKNIRFDENLRYMEDIVFLSEYVLHIKKVEFVADCNYIYNVTEGSLSNSIDKVNSHILDINHCLDIINDRIKNIDSIILQKRCKMIESELGRYSSMEVLKNIQTDDKAMNSIEKVYNCNIRLSYKIIFFIVCNNCKILFFLYINIRKILKNVKVR